LIEIFVVQSAPPVGVAELGTESNQMSRISMAVRSVPDGVNISRGEPRRSWAVQSRESVGSRGGGGEVRCVDVMVDRCHALPTIALVVVNIEVSVGADESDLKVDSLVKHVERPADMKDDFLTQICSLFMSFDDFIGDIGHSPLVRADDVVSGRLVFVKVRLDEFRDRGWRSWSPRVSGRELAMNGTAEFE
jgi:hypothetical protein